MTPSAIRSRAWREANPELSRISSRQNVLNWQKANPEKVKAKNARYRKTHEDVRKQYSREYAERKRKENPEAARDKIQDWRQKNPERYRNASIRAKGKRRAQKLGTQIIPITNTTLQQKWDYWGGLCWICKSKASAWDHVKPLSKNGPHILANLRPACKPCNSHKHAKWPFQI